MQQTTQPTQTYQVKNENEYFKLYQCLFDHPDYAPLSNDAVMLFALISNKTVRISGSDYSEMYTDDKGYYVPNNRMRFSELLGRSPESVSRYLRQLEAVGLIERTKHRIYPLKPKTDRATHYYVNKAGVRKLSYYKLPKVLVYDPKYQSLDNNTKMVYAVLRHRYSFTVKKGNEAYKDSNGRYFCKFCNDSLSAVLNIKADTIRKCKNRLIALSLLTQVREISGSLNRTVYRLYVYQAKKTEVQTENDTDNAVDDKPLQDSVSEPEKTHNVKNRSRIMSKIGTSNTAYNYTVLESTPNEMSAMNDKSSAYEEYSALQQALHTAQYRIDIANKEFTCQSDKLLKARKLRNYPRLLSSMLMNFGLDEISMICGILVKSKDELNAIYDTDYTLEDMDFVLAHSLRKVHNNTKHEAVIKKLGYIKTTVMKDIKKDVIGIEGDDCDDCFDLKLLWAKNKEMADNLKAQNKGIFATPDKSDKREELSDAELDALGVY